MNIPKFQAWHIESKVMMDVIGLTFHPVLEIYCGENEHGEELLFTADEVTLRQSTGLTDSKGVEIFEGDILQKDPKNEDWVHVKIEWHKEKATFVYVHIYNKYEFGYMDDRGYSDYIVIGDIHANKDLLNDNM